MGNKKEGAFEILCAFLVLFTTMLNPWVSAGLSVILLAGFGVSKYFRK